MRPVITLTTDFGLDDPFVGIMKGVILNIVPDAQIVDITHNIEPQNITQAALVLNAAYLWFPRKTVHVVIVDPGVGGGFQTPEKSTRKASTKKNRGPRPGNSQSNGDSVQISDLYWPRQWSAHPRSTPR